MKDPTRSRKKPAFKGAIPPAVEEAIMPELALREKGDDLGPIADRWGVTRRQVADLINRKKLDINELRSLAAENGFVLANTALDRLREKLSDNEAVAETPIRDLSMTYEKLINASVTAQEGHAPAVQNNFLGIKLAIKAVAAFDEQAKQLREAKVIDA